MCCRENTIDRQGESIVNVVPDHTTAGVVVIAGRVVRIGGQKVENLSDRYLNHHAQSALGLIL